MLLDESRAEVDGNQVQQVRRLRGLMEGEKREGGGEVHQTLCELTARTECQEASSSSTPFVRFLSGWVHASNMQQPLLQRPSSSHPGCRAS